MQTFPEGVDPHGSPRLQTVQLYLVSAGRQQLTLKLQRLKRGVMPVGGSSFHSENTNRGGRSSWRACPSRTGAGMTNVKGMTISK